MNEHDGQTLLFLHLAFELSAKCCGNLPPDRSLPQRYRLKLARALGLHLASPFWDDGLTMENPLSMFKVWFMLPVPAVLVQYDM